MVKKETERGEKQKQREVKDGILEYTDRSRIKTKKVMLSSK